MQLLFNCFPYSIRVCIICWASQEELVAKKPAANAGDTRHLDSTPWVGMVPLKRKWQPTPVFLPGESHGQRSLAGYSPRGHKESGMDGSDLAHKHGSAIPLLAIYLNVLKSGSQTDNSIPMLTVIFITMVKVWKQLSIYRMNR